MKRDLHNTNVDANGLLGYSVLIVFKYMIDTKSV